jgi:RNA polymerase sigma-70 factor (ECF subfamily)
MLPQRSHPRISLVGGSACREVTNAELARALTAGNAWAVDETWNRFSPKIHLMAYRALGVQSEAEDVVQEVFLRVFRKAKSIREPEKLYNFIRSFAIYVIKNELRRRKTRSWLSFHQPEALVDMVSDTLDIESRHLLRRFYALLDRLRPRDRLIYSLRNFEHMTVEEIVESTQLSMSTVKRSLVHATDKLSLWSENDREIAELLDAKGAKR